MRMERIAITAALTLGLLTTGLEAAPLNLTQRFPDIFAGSLDNNYDASTDTFTVTGSIDQFTESDGSTSYLANGTYEIEAEIDDAGDLASGRFWVGDSNQDTSGGEDGWVDDGDSSTGEPGGTPQTLLVGDLTAFGFSGSGNTTVFEFLGEATDGALRQRFLDQLPKVGIILDPGSTTFDGSFDSDFTNSGGGTTDTFVAPEPGSAAILLAPAAVALLGRSSARRNRRAQRTRA